VQVNVPAAVSVEVQGLGSVKVDVNSYADGAGYGAGCC